MPTESLTSSRRAKTADNEARALTMRLAGETYRQIGEQLGVTTAAAYKMVRRVLDRTRKAADESAAELRQLEQERLDALLLALWKPATQGNQGAVDRVLRIMERRAKLLGLDAPTKTDVTSGGQALTFHVVYEE